jgi:hypothetical protein
MLPDSAKLPVISRACVTGKLYVQIRRLLGVRDAAESCAVVVNVVVALLISQPDQAPMFVDTAICVKLTRPEFLQVTCRQKRPANNLVLGRMTAALLQEGYAQPDTAARPHPCRSASVFNHLVPKQYYDAFCRSAQENSPLRNQTCWTC